MCNPKVSIVPGTDVSKASGAGNNSPESIKNQFSSLAQGLLAALHFAALKHRGQRRKGMDSSPYINHPIAVAELLARVAGVADVTTLQAAVLHDTLEDTRTTSAELDEHFGTSPDFGFGSHNQKWGRVALPHIISDYRRD